MKHLIRILLIGLSLTIFSASAQWVWLGKDGRKVFSDRAPALDIPEKNILKQPGAALKAAEPTASDAAPVAVVAKPAAAKASSLDANLAARKAKADQAEQAKRQAEASKTAQIKADNCERAKQAKLNFESGSRVSRINKQGEREIMDDASRALELKRIAEIIASQCQ